MNTVTLKQLHNIVDIVNPEEYEIVYKLLTKFISETEPLPDEVEAVKRLDAAIVSSDIVDFNDVDWD